MPNDFGEQNFNLEPQITFMGLCETKVNKTYVKWEIKLNYWQLFKQDVLQKKKKPNLIQKNSS